MKLELNEIGSLTSIFSIAFALAKLIGGMAIDRYSNTTVMIVTLIFAGLSNVLFSISKHLMLFTILWGINGIFQGISWNSRFS